LRRYLGHYRLHQIFSGDIDAYENRWIWVVQKQLEQSGKTKKNEHSIRERLSQRAD